MLWALGTLLVFCIRPASGVVLLTFDDLSDNGSGTSIPSNYHGLSWTNFGVVNAVLIQGKYPSNGFTDGMLSTSNVALNAFGNPAEIDSPGTTFSLLSAYVTGAWHSNMDFRVQGFLGGAAVYDETNVVAFVGPTLVEFDHQAIDRAVFTSFGGDDATPGHLGFSEVFAMDNLSIDIIPEPSTWALLATGLVVLLSVKRRQA